MTIRGLSLDQARTIASEIGVEYQGSDTSGPRKGVETSGVLRPLRGRPNPYQRMSASPFHERRVAAVCWHGHRDFMRRVFEVNPEARISSALATYSGREDFEDKHVETAYTNIGSQMYPVYAAEACTCTY